MARARLDRNVWDYLIGGAETELARKAAEKEEPEAISIHNPTWITGLLKSFWYNGPASLSAAGALAPDGAPVAESALRPRF